MHAPDSLLDPYRHDITVHEGTGLYESLPYTVPLLLDEDQHTWLQDRFPHEGHHVPLTLTPATLRAHPWQISQLHTPLIPFPLGAELTSLPRLAVQALSHIGEPVPGELDPDASPRAWLDDRSVRLVPPVSPDRPYQVTFSFLSNRALYHTLQGAFEAIAREAVQKVRAGLLEARVQQLEARLAQVPNAPGSTDAQP